MAGEPQTTTNGKKTDVPKGLWTKCAACLATVYQKEVIENLHVCPECGFHHRIGAATRIRQLCDPDTFDEFNRDLVSTDPLRFVWDAGNGRTTYRKRLKEVQQSTRLAEAVVTGQAFIRGRSVILAVMDPNFMMGSMGAVVGEKITAAVERAADHDLPLIVVTTSGGARMQEGMVSLMQMAKTSAALAKFDEAKGLYIVVMADPTTAGVAASFAFLGDVILAEPKAMIGFAGPRVIANTIKAELPEGFQTAEFMLEHGHIDRIVERKNLRTEIARIIDYCGK